MWIVAHTLPTFFDSQAMNEHERNSEPGYNSTVIGDGGKSSVTESPNPEQSPAQEDVSWGYIRYEIAHLIPARFQLCLSHDIFRWSFAELFILLKVNHPWSNTVCPCWGEMKIFFPHVRQRAATSPTPPPHPGKQSNHFCYYTCYQHSASLPASPFHLSQLSSFLSECTSSFSNFPFGGFNTQITITLQCTHSNPNFPFTGFSSFSEEKIVLHYISIHLCACWNATLFQA